MAEVLIYDIMDKVKFPPMPPPYTVEDFVEKLKIRYAPHNQIAISVLRCIRPDGSHGLMLDSMIANFNDEGVKDLQETMNRPDFIAFPDWDGFETFAKNNGWRTPTLAEVINN
jgi:hypothetical protein